MFDPAVKVAKAKAAEMPIDARYFERNFIGYGSPKVQTVEIKRLMNIALAKLGEAPVAEKIGFSESDAEKLQLIRSRFSIDPQSGKAVALTVENGLQGVRNSSICGLVTAQILSSSLAERPDKMIPFERFKQITGGRWDRSQLKPGEPEWLVSDFPIPSEIRSGKLFNQFYAGVRQVSEKLNIPPNWLLSVMAIESGLSPTARHPYSDARGYLQFLPVIRTELNKSGAPVVSDPIKQLKAVEHYLHKRLNGRTHLLRGPEDIYALVLGPSHFGKEILYTMNQTPKAYKMNSWLDIDRGGQINRVDLRRVIELYWAWK